jgi:hypothetical protein
VTAGGKLDLSFSSNKTTLWLREPGASSWKVKSRGDLKFYPGVKYRCTIVTDGLTVTVKVYQVSKTSNVVTLKAKHSKVFKEKHNAKRLSIGKSNDTGTVLWDNIFLAPKSVSGKHMKYDYTTAADLVLKSFQGMIPFHASTEVENDYFTALVVSSETSMKETLDRLSVQNAKLWYFDYEGKFHWKSISSSDPCYTITDENDISSLSYTANTMEFTNWVESVSATTNIDGIPIKPKYRLSVVDTESVLKDGLRFQRVEDDTIVSSEQAKRIAKGKYYESLSDLEEISVSLAKPILFLQPMDTIRVDSKTFGDTMTKYGYSKICSVKSVSISGSFDGGIKMTCTLSSLGKALVLSKADLFSKGGVSF